MREAYKLYIHFLSFRFVFFHWRSNSRLEIPTHETLHSIHFGKSTGRVTVCQAPSLNRRKYFDLTIPNHICNPSPSSIRCARSLAENCGKGGGAVLESQLFCLEALNSVVVFVFVGKNGCQTGVRISALESCSTTSARCVSGSLHQQPLWPLVPDPCLRISCPRSLCQDLCIKILWQDHLCRITV